MPSLFHLYIQVTYTLSVVLIQMHKNDIWYFYVSLHVGTVINDSVSLGDESIHSVSKAGGSTSIFMLNKRNILAISGYEFLVSEMESLENILHFNHL